MILSTTGNLLSAQTDALVNTVNCVGVMGKGIALQFKRAWPTMFEAYVAACRQGAVAPGRLHVWAIPAESGHRHIVNFPTKRHWREGSRLEDIDAGLVDLRRLIELFGWRSLALPPLGCGNGGLDWRIVRPRVVSTIGELSARVELFEAGHV